MRMWKLVVRKNKTPGGASLPGWCGPEGSGRLPNTVEGRSGAEAGLDGVVELHDGCDCPQDGAALRRVGEFGGGWGGIQGERRACTPTVQANEERMRVEPAERGVTSGDVGDAAIAGVKLLDMPQTPSPNAKLIANVDPSRVDLAGGDGVSLPQIGDLVCVDQGLAGPRGAQMYMVYCDNPDGSTKWTADVYEWELEPLARQEVQRPNDP